MFEIDLGGAVALVDDGDWPLVAGIAWRGLIDRRSREIVYAIARIDGQTVYLHRLLMGALPGEEVDHEDGDGLNNRRGNLRLATHAQNLANQAPQSGRSSRFKGVSWYTRSGRWRATAARRHVGFFDDEEDAARAYDAAARAAFGAFARVNFDG